MGKKFTFPKVLIIGETFHTNKGGGVTLANLFKDWEKDNIATVCTGPFTNYLDLNICDKNYELGEKEIYWIFPFNKFQKKRKSGPNIYKSTRFLSNSKNKKPLRNKLMDSYIFPFLRYLGVYNKLIKVKASNQLLHWITDFNPDLIYIQASTYQNVCLALEICDNFSQPKVFHMMDDWVSKVKTKGLLKNYWYLRTNHVLKNLFSKCNLLLGISNFMADEYLKRYQMKFYTFHNPIDIEFWGSDQKKDYSTGKVITILYAGRIGHGIDSSLKQFALGIHKYNFENSIKIKLILQTQFEPNWISKFSFIEHNNQVAYELLPQSFSHYDFLLMPIDFSAEGFDFLRFSMPTKASEYMISGTPIIIFSPKDTAIVNYAEKEKWAYCITNNNPYIIKCSLSELVNNLDLRKILAFKGIQTAMKNHEGKIIRGNFQNLLFSVLIPKVNQNELI